MPLYEYQCQGCDHSFEKLVFNINDEPLTCPKCDETRVKKMMSLSSMMMGSDKASDTCGKAGYS